MARKKAEPLSDWQQKMQEERQRIETAVSEVVTACHGKARMDEVLARALDKHSCPSLYLEWTSDKFWALQMPKLVKDLDKIYSELVKKKITRRKKIDFNDADDTLYFLPHKKHKVIVHTGQSFRFIYIWDKGKTYGHQRLHVRQFYDVWQPPTDDKYDHEDVDRFKAATQAHGYKEAIKKAQAFTEEYADDYKDNPYPNRYSLSHYVKGGYEVKYGDFRDKGYVLTWEEFSNKVEGSMYRHNLIKLITECFVPSILCELFGDTDDAISANDTSSEKDFDSWPKDD